MPTMSGPNPLSVGQFDGTAGNSPVQQATGGISALGQAMIGNPAAIAQAGYLGAEAARAKAQTGQINTQQQDLQTASQLMQDPTALTDPLKVQAIGALLIKYPEQAKALPGLLATSMAASAANGGAVSQTQADNFAGTSGAVPIENTPTGQGRALATSTTNANISAGPGYAAAAASVANNKNSVAEQGREFDQSPENVTGPSGPTIVPRAQAATGGYSPYSPGADTANKTLTAGVLNSQPAYATPSTPGFQPQLSSDSVLANAMTGQLKNGAPAPAPSTPAQVQTNATAGGTMPVPGTSPSQSPVPGQPTAGGTMPVSSSPSAPGEVPSTGSPLADAMIRQKLAIPNTIPAPAGDDVTAGAKLDAAINLSLQRNLITPDMSRGLGAVATSPNASTLSVDPAARSAILERVNALTHSADPRFKNNTDASIEQAIQDLKPSLSLDKGNGPMTYVPNILGGSPYGPVVRWKPPVAPAGGGAAPAPAPAGLASAMAPAPAAAPPVQAAPPAAPAAPAAPQPNPATGQMIAQAKAALAQGAPLPAVQQRLRGMGIDPTLLGQ
jgi:hypothetical protein